ncbi:MAG: hypothetical protein IJW19_05790 [Clostridia bacterium]|nr:hypothetical protein [Clostridia bacterium]
MLDRLKSCCVSALAVLIIVIRAIIVKPAFDYSYFIICGIAVLSLVASIFKRTFIKWNMSVSKEEYATFTVNLFIIISSALPVLLAFILW